MHLSFANGLFWVSVACCLVAQLFIVRSVLGARHVPNPAANVPRARGSVEFLWAIVPAVGLAVLLVFTWRAVREHETISASTAVTAR
jgi:heme/copper-type cytochrome/quinol oxidase subunit 2